MEGLEIIFEVVLEVIFALIDDIKISSVDFSSIKDSNLIVKSEKEAYIIGILATTITICYCDDNKIDRHEKKMIMKTVKKYKTNLSRHTKANIKYLFKYCNSTENLKSIYKRLNLNKYVILKIINQIEFVFKDRVKGANNQIDIVNKLKIEYGFDNRYSDTKESA